MTRRDALVAAGTLTVTWVWQTWGFEVLFACGVAVLGVAAGWSVRNRPERGPESDRRYAQEHRA